MRHELTVAVDYRERTLAVTDRIELHGGDMSVPNGWLMALNSGFDPAVAPDEAARGARLDRLSTQDAGVIQRYRVYPAPGSTSLTIRYAGSPRFESGPTATASNTPGGDLRTHGYLDASGVQLSGAHAWYPQVVAGERQRLVTFEIDAALPKGWSAVTQGATGQATPQGLKWAQANPQPDIHLLAGPYNVTRRSIATDAGPIEAATYLLAADEAVARTYLDAAQAYLPLYTRLLGAYPYSTFALVENRHQTGFGMPGFTLLGSRVIRLPFIPHTSYPHEIVHNWFGNGVYVDPAGGNWSEGLTAYLADHLSAEHRKQDVQFRQRSLRKYRNYAGDDQEQARLADFRARHDGASAAIGYDKALMVFHALRRRLGDDVFFHALRELYAAHRFESTNFDDLRRAFESSAQAAGKAVQLASFFKQWIDRPGAPALELHDVEVTHTGGDYRVRGTLVQVQSAASFELDVPIAIHSNDARATWHEVAMRGRTSHFDLAIANAPTHLDVDPLFDLPRRLALRELAPSLGELFSARAVSQSLSASGNDDERPWLRGAHYASLARLLDVPQRDATGSRHHATWIFGFDHPDVARFVASTKRGALIKHANEIEILGQRYSVADHCFAMAARDGDDTPLGWIVCEPEAGERAAAGLTKLKHYASAGYLVTPGISDKRATYGDWPPPDSPLKLAFAPGTPRAKLPVRVPKAPGH